MHRMVTEIKNIKVIIGVKKTAKEKQIEKWAGGTVKIVKPKLEQKKPK